MDTRAAAAAAKPTVPKLERPPWGRGEPMSTQEAARGESMMLDERYLAQGEVKGRIGGGAGWAAPAILIGIACPTADNH